MMFVCNLTRDCDGCPRFNKCFDENEEEIEEIINEIVQRNLVSH